MHDYLLFVKTFQERTKMSDLISHEGIVEEAAGGRVRVRIIQTAACAACKAKSMCTASETMVKEIDAIPVEPMELGDNVIVEVEKKLGWKAVLLSFVCPFLLVLLLVWLIPHWVENEALVGTLALASLAPYYIILHHFSKRFEEEYRFTARKK